MKHILYTCFFLFVCLLQTGAQEEDDSTRKLISFIKNINTFNQLYPQEKVYLHFDNTGYYMGETIWFKSYLTIADNNLPNVLSKVLYVELLSPEGEIKKTLKLKIKNGQCHGDFKLEPEWYSGFYEVRAYTRMMLNYGPEVIFSRVFPIYDEPKNEGEYKNTTKHVRPVSQNIPFEREKNKKLKNVNCSFFPEGGNLVNGLLSKIAFRITDKNGQGIEAEGSVYNEKKELITTFHTIHKGMGSFGLVPDSQKYTAKIKYLGKEYSFLIPMPDKDSGYVININNLRKDDIYIQIQKSNNQTPEHLGLSLSCRGKICYFDTLSVRNTNGFVLKIPRTNLPEGVIQTTLFTAEGEILCNRLIFSSDEAGTNHIELKHTTDKISYKPFEKVTMDFQMTDFRGNPVETNFSLAIRDLGNKTGIWQDDIRSNLLLSSDLKGFIENPQYYFESQDATHWLALDLLMMTQGWSRYSWKQMTGIEPFTPTQVIEEGLLIDGQILSNIRKKKKVNTEVSMWMYSEDGVSLQGVCMTDEEGKFSFMPEDFYGTWNMFLRTTEKGEKQWNRVLLNRVFAPTPRAYNPLDLLVMEGENIMNTILLNDSVPEEPNDSIDMTGINTKDSHILPQVTVKGKKPTKNTDEGLEMANIVYDVEKLVTKMEDKGDNYVEDINGFLLKTNKYFTEICEEDNCELFYKNRPVRYVINNLGEGLGAFNRRNISASDIETIMISEDRFVALKYFGITPEKEKPPVVVFLYTYGDNRRRADVKGFRSTKIDGYSYVNDFFNPNYDRALLPEETDFRRTLYWNPDVKTDQTGKATVNFYNNGTCSQMEISAEGLTNDGIPFTQ